MPRAGLCRSSQEPRLESFQLPTVWNPGGRRSGRTAGHRERLAPPVPLNGRQGALQGCFPDLGQPDVSRLQQTLKKRGTNGNYSTVECEILYGVGGGGWGVCRNEQNAASLKALRLLAGTHWGQSKSIEGEGLQIRAATSLGDPRIP